GVTNMDEVERLAPSICEGKPVGLRAGLLNISGSRIQSSGDARRLLCRITKLMNMREFILEDRARDLGLGVFDCQVKTRTSGNIFVRDAQLIDDGRVCGHYGFEARMKTHACLRIVQRRSVSGDLGVVFVRTMEPLKEIVASFEQRRVRVTALHGEMPDAER